MVKHYLHKSTVTIAIICVLAVSGTAAYTYSQYAPISNENTPAIDITDNVVNIATSSTDWVSQFFDNSSSTNPYLTKSNDSSSNITVTDQFSRDTFIRLMDLKQSDLLKNNLAVSSTISDLIDQYASTNKPKSFNINDLRIISSNETSVLKTYGNNVGYILKTYGPSQDSATIALAGLQGKDNEYVQKLQKNAESYHLILNKLLETPSPQSMSAYHLDLVYAASDMSSISTSLSMAETDPMTAITGLGLYETAFKLGLGALLHIRNDLHSSGITYTATEGGSFFLKP